MDAFTSILVDVDASAPVHPALTRAARLARGSGATLTVVDVLMVPPAGRQELPGNVEERLFARRRQQLETLARCVTDVPATPRLLTGRPATALIDEVARGGHDLVVRAHIRDAAGPSSGPFGAVDMELLRKCPCPVLLVGPWQTSGPARVVGAVNASAHDPAEQELNGRIVEFTRRMATLEDAIPLLLYAWTPFAERVVRGHATGDAFDRYVETVRARSARDLAQLAQQAGGGIEAVLRRGEPEDVLPEFVVAEGIDLLVMGTVARTGLLGLLFGNTAERILRRLPCSVLALKPVASD